MFSPIFAVAPTRILATVSFSFVSGLNAVAAANVAGEVESVVAVSIATSRMELRQSRKSSFLATKSVSEFSCKVYLDVVAAGA